MALREALLAFLVSLGATVALYRLRTLVPFVNENLHALVGTVFFVLPILLLQRRGARFAEYGIALGGLLGDGERRSGLWGLILDLGSAARRNYRRVFSDIVFSSALALVVFPPFWFGFRLYYQTTSSFVLTLPDDFWGLCLAQLVVVGLPEEFFYRGYLQTRLRDVFPKVRRFGGADISIGALLLTSILFALGHFLVDLAPARLAVFFPSLLFGWIREKRGSIGASAFFHAFCNVFADLLTMGYQIR